VIVPNIEVGLDSVPHLLGEPACLSLSPFAEVQAAYDRLLGRHPDRLADLLAQIFPRDRHIQQRVRLLPHRLIAPVIALVEARYEREEAVVLKHSLKHALGVLMVFPADCLAIESAVRDHEHQGLPAPLRAGAHEFHHGTARMLVHLVQEHAMRAWARLAAAPDARSI
jgi:hypothetical protein